MPAIKATALEDVNAESNRPGVSDWRPTGSDSIGDMRGHVGVTRREDVKRSFVVRNYPTG